MHRLGLGTAAIGRPQYINIRTQKQTAFNLSTFRQKGKNILDMAYDQGIRYFDTAPGYGLAEDLMIEWLQEKPDPTIEVATKWGYTYTANFSPTAKQHEVKEHSLAKLQEQWRVSKQLLPFMKVYQIHSATHETGVLENQEVLNYLAELKNEYQLIIGITTTGPNQIDIIKTALEVVVNGQALFDAFQVTYNMLDQSLASLAPSLKAANKRIIVKEALANGRVFPNPSYPHYQPMYRLLQDLALKYGVGIDAIALALCIQTINPYTVLSGAGEENHLRQNLLVNQLILEEKDLIQLRKFGINPQIYWSERKQLEWN